MDELTPEKVVAMADVCVRLHVGQGTHLTHSCRRPE